MSVTEVVANIHSVINKLEDWLTSQKASGHLPRKTSRLRVTNGEAIDEESD